MEKTENIYYKLTQSVCVIAKQWDSIAKTQDPVIIQGLFYKFSVLTPSVLDVDVHCHGSCLDKARRLDLMIYLNGKPFALGKVSDNVSSFLPGMGLSRSVDWVPIIARANMIINPGSYEVDVRMRNPFDNGQIRANAAAMNVQIHQS